MNPRIVLLMVLLAALFLGHSFAKDNVDQRGADLLANAASLQNIREQGAQPFQLRMHIHVEHVVTKPADGDYAEIWMAPDKWRREVVFPGFTQLEIGDVDSKWLSRNLDFRPRALYLMAIAIDAFVRPRRSQDEVIKSIRNRKVAGAVAQCIEVVGKNPKLNRELCFDTAGHLIRETYGDQRFEYDSFGRFGAKAFPKSIRVYEFDQRILDITADNLISPADPRPELFQHSGTARHLAGCEMWPAEQVKKVAPEYPPAARAAHQQGSVFLYAQLSERGTVEKTSILQSAGDSLDRSATEAVKQWEYPPAPCGTMPLPTEIEVRVKYELR